MTSAAKAVAATKTERDAFGRIIPQERLKVKDAIRLQYVGRESWSETRLPDGTTERSNHIEPGEIREFMPLDAKEALHVRVNGKPVWRYADDEPRRVWGQGQPQPLGVGNPNASDFNMAAAMKKVVALGIADQIEDTMSPEQIIGLIDAAEAKAEDGKSESTTAGGKPGGKQP